MPSSELAEYLLHDYIRTHLTVRQQSEIRPLLTQWHIAVRTENDHRTNALLVRFIEKLQTVELDVQMLKDHDSELRRLLELDAPLHERVVNE